MTSWQPERVVRRCNYLGATCEKTILPVTLHIFQNHSPITTQHLNVKPSIKCLVDEILTICHRSSYLNLYAQKKTSDQKKCLEMMCAYVKCKRPMLNKLYVCSHQKPAASPGTHPRSFTLLIVVCDTSSIHIPFG